jgi:uncharacterized protein (TIGR02453 family)
MRVHRDVRFSKNRSPYKTNVGIQFRHEDGKDVHAPGLYLHIEIDNVFLGAGMWRPDADSLAAIRASIDETPAKWRKIRDHGQFRKQWNFSGDSLKRPPRGYPADHPMIEDLKRKDHIAVTNLKTAQVTRAGFVEHVAELFKQAKPLLCWQASALELNF